MAKYGKSASKHVESAMRRRKKGRLKSNSGQTVKSRKQAIAIGLSEARERRQSAAQAQNVTQARSKVGEETLRLTNLQSYLTWKTTVCGVGSPETVKAKRYLPDANPVVFRL